MQEEADRITRQIVACIDRITEKVRGFEKECIEFRGAMEQLRSNLWKVIKKDEV